MVAEPGPTTSEKRQTLLNKEQINDDEKRKMKATLDGEFKSLEKADYVRSMEQERCGHGNKNGMRLKEKETEQQLAEVATEVIQDETIKTKMMKNAGNEESRDHTMMKMMCFSVQRDHDDSDVSDMIKQVYAKSDIISRFVCHLSGMKDTIDRLQSETDCCMALVKASMEQSTEDHDVRCDRALAGMQEEFETKAANVDENMSSSTMLMPGVSSFTAAANAEIAPEVIDEAGTRQFETGDNAADTGGVGGSRDGSHNSAGRIRCYEHQQEQIRGAEGTLLRDEGCYE